MKAKYIILIAGIVLSCQQSAPRTLPQLLEDFESELPREFPDYATAVEMPAASDILVIPTRKTLKKNLAFCEKYLKEFKEFEPPKDSIHLNEQRIEKIEMLTGMIERMTGPRSPFNDPGYYNVYPALAWRISQLRQTPDSTHRNLLEKTLKKVPVYFSHAKENLDDPDIPRTTAAIAHQRKTMSFLKINVEDFINSLPDTDTDHKNTLKSAQDAAYTAVKDYSDFCESILAELKKLE